MKRLLVCLAALLLLSGCVVSDPSLIIPTDPAQKRKTEAPTTPAPTLPVPLTTASTAPTGGWNYNTDCQTGLYSSQMMRADVAESEDGLYYMVDRFLYFYDYASGLCVPLCSRPNCLHDKLTDSKQMALCGAYLEGDMNVSIFWQSGKLYALTAQWVLGTKTYTTQLLEFSPDGTQRRTLYRFQGAAPVMGAEFCAHRGWLYLCESGYDEQMNLQSDLVRVSLNGNTRETLYTCRRERLSEMENPGGGLIHLLAVGDNLYFLEMRGVQMVPMRLLLNTGAVVPLLENYPQLSSTTPLPLGDRLFLITTDVSATCDPDGSNLTRCADIAPGYMVSNGAYLYVLDLSAFRYTDRDTLGLRIYDRDGALVQDLPLETQLPGGEALYCTREALLVKTRTGRETHLYALSLAALLEGRVEPQQVY